MPHGNTSDLVFLGLVGVVVQMWAKPETLFQDLGPVKAQFSTKSADMDALIKFAGGLFLIIGGMLSGVSWNPINGKMGGLGGFVTSINTAYSTFKSDSDQVVPHLVCLALASCGLACLFYPEHLYTDLGPLKAQLTIKSADTSAMIKLVGCLMLQIELTFSGVKWNPINGKMAGICAFIATGYAGYFTFKADKDAFVPRLIYVYPLILFMGAVHIFAFPSNPLPPKADKKNNKDK